MIKLSKAMRRDGYKVAPDQFITPMRQIRLTLWHDAQSIGQITVSLGPETPIERARTARNILINAIRAGRIPNPQALDQFCRELRNETQAKNADDRIPPRRQGLRRNTEMRGGESRPTTPTNTTDAT